MKKTFNNNFTTPAQSQRLLELGVPADTADCGIVKYLGVEILAVPYSQWCKEYENISMPCWSVGRLIEIYLRCCRNQLVIKRAEFGVADLVSMLEICHLKGWFDFSKLEE